MQHKSFSGIDICDLIAKTWHNGAYKNLQYNALYKLSTKNAFHKELSDLTKAVT